MRYLKVGEKNYSVTEIVDKVTGVWNCKPVESKSPLYCKSWDWPSVDMLSCQYEQNVIDGKKTIILNPAEQQRRDVASVTFAENEIYGVDILVVSAEDGKVCI